MPLILFLLPLAGSTGSGSGSGAGLAVFVIFVIFAAVSICLGLAYIAVTVRRLHDTSRSAWWLLISFVPLAGGLILLIITSLKGTPGPNLYQS